MESLICPRLANRIQRRIAFVAPWLLVAMGFTAGVPVPANAQLRGHGGPVRALAISPDGATALSGSFDTSAIRWSLTRNAAEQVLRFHESAVNAVAVAAGWPHRHRRRGRPHRDLEAGRAAARRPCSKATPRRSSRSRCRPTARRSPRRRGITRSGSGRSPAATHARARRPQAERQRRRLHARWQVAGQRRLRPDRAHLAARRRRADHRHAADAAQRRCGCAATARSSPAAPTARSSSSRRTASCAARSRPAQTPIIALAVSDDGTLVAAAGIRGSVAIIERKARKLARTLVGPGLPVWSVGVPARQPHACSPAAPTA